MLTVTKLAQGSMFTVGVAKRRNSLLHRSTYSCTCQKGAFTIFDYRGNIASSRHTHEATKTLMWDCTWHYTACIG